MLLYRYAVLSLCSWCVCNFEVRCLVLIVPVPCGFLSFAVYCHKICTYSDVNIFKWLILTFKCATYGSGKSFVAVLKLACVTVEVQLR